MSKIISANAGSSSLKYQLYELPEYTVIAKGQIEKIGKENAVVTINLNDVKQERIMPIADHKEAVLEVFKDLLDYKALESLDEIDGVGHRIVHGGEFFKDSVEPTPWVIETVDRLSELAPLHNPANLIGYFAFKKALKQARHVFVFDTAFHQTMKPEAFMYALPYEYYTNYKVRKYGMHGTSHRYVSERTAELLNKDFDDVNLIVCHLGNGASITAIKKGQVIDTSMGFTPLAGIMMGTRTGDVDPAVFPYLLEKTNLTPKELIDVYNNESGMLGISGISNDARDIRDAINKGDKKAILTMEMYAQKIASYIGSYYVQLGQLDAVVFTAGLGENDHYVRENIVGRISEALKIDFNRKLNKDTKAVEVELTKTGSKTKVFIVPTNEELLIAQDTQRILGL